MVNNVLISRLSQRVHLVYQRQYMNDGQWMVEWIQRETVWASMEPMSIGSMKMSDHIAYLDSAMPTLYRLMIRRPHPTTMPKNLKRIMWDNRIFETIHPWAVVGGNAHYLQTIVREISTPSP
jgi:hypothetical protein